MSSSPVSFYQTPASPKSPSGDDIESLEHRLGVMLAIRAKEKGGLNYALQVLTQLLEETEHDSGLESDDEGDYQTASEASSDVESMEAVNGSLEDLAAPKDKPQAKPVPTDTADAQDTAEAQDS